MYQQCIGTGLYCGLNQVHAGGDTGNQQFNLVPSLDLKTIWTIILKLFHRQQRIRIISQRFQGYHVFTSC